MKKILSGALALLTFTATQPVFASEKIDGIVANGKKSIEMVIGKTPTTDNLKLEQIENTKVISIKPRKRKIKFPRKKELPVGSLDSNNPETIGAVIEGKSLAVPMEYVKKGEQVIVAVESIKDGEDVAVAVESVKKGEDVAVPVESVKKGEEVLVDIESVKKGKKVVVAVEFVKEGEEVMVYTTSVKPGTKVKVPIEFVKKGEDIDVPVEAVKKGEDIVVSVESIKKGEKVLAPVEAVKEGKQVEISIEPKKETDPVILAKTKKLEKYSYYKNAEQIFDLTETYKKHIETGYINNKIYFWSLFMTLIDEKNIDRIFVEILNKNNDIDEVKLTQLKKLVAEKFGEDVYEKIYAYLFYVSLNQLWEEGNALYLSYKKDGYRILSPEIVDKLITRGFVLTNEEGIGEAFTFQKTYGTIEIISVAGKQINIIGELSLSTIENLETNFYSILDYIFKTIDDLPSTPLKDIIGSEK